LKKKIKDPNGATATALVGEKLSRRMSALKLQELTASVTVPRRALKRLN